MTMRYTQAQIPEDSLVKIDALIDAHTLENYPEHENLESKLYAIEAENESGFAGGIAFTKQFETAHVNALAVEKAYRGQQIGSSLLKEMEQYVESIGVHTVSLSTLSYQALDFYQKLGYTLSGSMIDYPRRGLTKYALYKRLPNY